MACSVAKVVGAVAGSIYWTLFRKSEDKKREVTGTECDRGRCLLIAAITHLKQASEQNGKAFEVPRDEDVGCVGYEGLSGITGGMAAVGRCVTNSQSSSGGVTGTLAR